MRRMKTSLDFRPPGGAQWTLQTTEHVPYSKRDSKQSETTPSKYHVTYCRLHVFKNWNNESMLLALWSAPLFWVVGRIETSWKSFTFKSCSSCLSWHRRRHCKIMPFWIPVKSYIITAIFVFYSYVDISTLSMYFIDFVKLASGSICCFLKSFVFDLYGDYVICK